MKNLYNTFAIIILVCTTIQAQTFEFSLSYMGINPETDNYQFALVATPSSSVTDGNTADMGAGFYVPSGLTIGNFVTGNSNLPATEWTSQTLGASNANGDPYFVSRIEAGANSILLNGMGPFELVLFDVIADPNPTEGGILFVENGDPVFNELLFIENYININLGSGTDNYYSQNDPTANQFMFDTLSLIDQTLESQFSIYPNPASSFINIRTTKTITGIELFDILGKRVLSKKTVDQIPVSQYKSGIYLLKITTNHGTFTKKVVIE